MKPNQRFEPSLGPINGRRGEPSRPGTSPFRGLPWLALASMLLAVGLAVNYLVQSQEFGNWSVPARVTYWMVVWGAFVYGLQVLLDRFLPKSGPGRFLSLGRNRVVIPRQGLSYLGIMIMLFVGSLLGHNNMLLLVFAMMVGPFILNGSVAFGALQGTRVQRRVPLRAMVGEAFTVEVEAQNQSRFVSSWMIEANDTIEHSRERLRASVLFTRIPPTSRELTHYQLRLQYRGRYRFGPLQIATRFPLGLVERRLIVPEHNEISIYPRIGRLTPHARKTASQAIELVNQSRSHAGMFDDEFHRLREFRIGDNPRAIHWRTSARKNELVLREYHQNREHSLHLLIDLSGPAALPPARVEDALSLAATLAWEHVRTCRDAMLGVSLHGEQSWQWLGPATTPSLEVILDQLAAAQATTAPLPAVALDQVQQLAPPSARLIWITAAGAPLANGSTNGGSHASPARGSRWQVINLSLIPLDHYVVFPEAGSSLSAAAGLGISNGGVQHGTQRTEAAIPRPGAQGAAPERAAVPGRNAGSSTSESMPASRSATN